MIFYFKAAQNLVAMLYVSDLDMFFHSKKTQKLGCSNIKEILNWFFTLRLLKTLLQSTMKNIFYDFSL